MIINMKVIKKLFGGIEMTYIKVILFAVLTAIITAALLLIPVFENSPLRDMGVNYDWWIIFAIFVVINCKKPLEAGLKCFIFFLISQPLIYLFQQPFSQIDLLRNYYGRWFFQTLLTFPGGIIAFYIKRKEIWSALILAVAGAYLGISGISKIVFSIHNCNVPYIIDGVFFTGVAILFGFIFCSGKKQILYLAIILACIIGVGAYCTYDCVLSGTYEYDIQHEGSWSPQLETFNSLSVSWEDDDTLLIEHGSRGNADLTIVNEDGETIHIIIVVSGGKVTVTETD